MQLRRASKGKREEGTVAIMVALMLVVLIGFAAFVVDTGEIFRVRNELQNVSDAAALAGARLLDGTAPGIVNAEQAAVDYAKKHWAAAKYMQDSDPNDLKITFGHWYLDDASLCDDPSKGYPCFQTLDTATVDPVLINAIKVLSYRSAHDNNASSPVHHYFAGFLGKPETDVGALAIAVGGGPYKDCAFPMVVPDCALENASGPGGSCEWCMQFQNANEDTAGWTSFGENGFPIEQLIANMCGTPDSGFLVDETTGECTGQCYGWGVADGDLPLFNGNSMNKNNYCGLIQDILLRDGTSVAKKFNVRVPVIKSSPGSDCDASQFSSAKPVAGFATVTIFGAKCQNNDPQIIDPTAGTTCPVPPSGKYILAKLLCDLDSSGISGGEFFGTEAEHIRLVK